MIFFDRSLLHSPLVAFDGSGLFQKTFFPVCIKCKKVTKQQPDVTEMWKSKRRLEMTIMLHMKWIWGLMSTRALYLIPLCLYILFIVKSKEESNQIDQHRERIRHNNNHVCF